MIVKKLKNTAFVIIILSALILFKVDFLYAQFGKNKVKYENFDWKFIETKHFDIYYHNNAKYLAEFIARMSEKSLKSIESMLNYRIAKRISLIIYNSKNEFQQTNIVFSYLPEGVGGLTELLKNRVIFPFSGDYDLFAHVVHHELVHAVLNDMFYGGTFQTALYSGVQIPIWMNEGLAEWESIGGMDTQTDMFMRDLSLSEKLVDLKELEDYLAYRVGQTFYWYIADRYGEQKVGDLINRLKIYGNADGAFRATFQMSMDDFSDKFLKDLKKYYWPDINRFKDPEDFSKRITNHKKERHYYNSSPSISPDGSKMAYIQDEDGTFGVYLMDLEKKENIKMLVSSFRQQDFEDLNFLTPGISWNPDGTKLAISAKAGGEDAVFIVDVESGDYDKLTWGLKSITSVSWSPDGKKLSFIATDNEYCDIYLYDFASENLSKLTNDVFTDLHPLWAPDSKSIYFISDRGNNLEGDFLSNNFKMWNYGYKSSDVYNIDLTTKKIKRITNDPQYQKSSIAISSDNKKLLFVSDKNGIGNIYQIDLETGKISPKTNSLKGISQISLSKDNSKLLFCSLIDAGYDIFMLRNPFDVRLDSDSLPLTALRQNQFEKAKLMENIAKNLKEGTLDSLGMNHKLIGYGKYNIDFSRQDLVKPNPDAVRKNNLAGLSDENMSDSAFSENDYKVKFTPDIVLGNPGYSTFFGLQGVTEVLFSDVMGDHQIFLQANLLIDLRNSTFYATYLYLPEVIDYSISGFHTVGFVNTSSTDTLWRFRSYGGVLGAQYPFDLFNRVECNLSILNASKENVYSTNGGGSVSRLLLTPEVRYVHDNTVFGWYGPYKGTRYFFDALGTPKISKDGVGFMMFDADYRYYIPLGMMYSFAFRGTTGASFGPNPRTFFLGGTENWINASFKDGKLPFNDPEDFAFLDKVIIMPLRGVSISEISGTRYFLANAEFRFPLLYALVAGPLPILVQGIQGDMFFDIGGAWDGGFSNFKSASNIDVNGNKMDNILPHNLVMSSGIGVRAYLFGLPIKLDIAWENLYYKWSQPTYMVSLGYDF